MLITTNIYLFLIVLRRFHSCLQSLLFQSAMQPGVPLHSYAQDFFHCFYVRTALFQIDKSSVFTSLHSRIPEGYQLICGICSPMLIVAFFASFATMLLCAAASTELCVFQSTPSTYISAVTGISVDVNWLLLNGR